MMGIGFPELMVILVIIMIIFGAGKLPEIGSAFGRSIKNFKTSMKEAEAEDTSSSDGAEPVAAPSPDEQVSPNAQAGPETQRAQATRQNPAAPAQEAQSSGQPSQAKKSTAKKEEEDIIDQAIQELKDELSETKIHTIRTRHDGLVQDSDVFTESVKKVPFGMKRTDRGVSRDLL